MHESEPKLPNGVQNETTQYEAPAIESVMTPEELEREVAYAGTGPQISRPIQCF